MSEPILPPSEHERLVAELTPVVRDAVRPRTRLRRQPWFWCFVVGAVIAAGAYVSLLAAVHGKDQQIDAARSDASSANAGLAAVASQVRSLGGTPVATASPGVGPQGPRGSRGPAPTEAQVEAAVATYCVQHAGCTGVPSRTQIATAVRAFCAAGACRGITGARGPSGASGRAGPSGASGQPGADGTGPTPDQVADAVAAYCTAHGGCSGPKGDTGNPGPQGSAGRGIASIDCTGLGVDQLVIHYDDGTDQAVPCNLNPTPTGAPS